MYIGDMLIYLETQKTGGSHIVYLLENLVNGQKVGVHNWLTSYGHNKFIISSIRNPWDWYISEWAFGCQHEGGVYKRVTSRKPFRKYVRSRNLLLVMNDLARPVKQWQACYEDVDDPTLFRKWLKQMYDPENRMVLEEFYYKSGVSHFAGIMTHRYCKLFLKNYFKQEVRDTINNLADLYDYDSRHNIVDFVIRTEALEDDFVKALHAAGVSLTEENINFVYESAEKPTNPSRHHPTAYYYDKETTALVAEKDKFIVDKFGYSPPVM